MVEIDDAIEIVHALEDARRRQVEVEGRHPDLPLVAELGPDAEVEAWYRRRHLAAPQRGVLQLADQGEGHRQRSAATTAVGAGVTRTTIHKPARMMAPPMSTSAVSVSPSTSAPVITPAIGISRMNGVTWSTRYLPST